MSKKTIYIAGLGLIGGSLALGIQRDHPDYEILGYNRSDYSRNIALERGIVQQVISKNLLPSRMLLSLQCQLSKRWPT